MNDMWKKVTDWNDIYFPNWINVNPVYHSNALAGEVGEICNTVKHLIGGGTNVGKSSQQELEDKILEEAVDSFIYGVLLLETLGKDASAFRKMFDKKMKKITERMKK